jgi:hypothetical protein
MSEEVGRDAFRLPDAALELVDALEAELTTVVDALCGALDEAEDAFVDSADGGAVKDWLGRLEVLLEDLGAIDGRPGFDD